MPPPTRTLTRRRFLGGSAAALLLSGMPRGWVGGVFAADGPETRRCACAPATTSHRATTIRQTATIAFFQLLPTARIYAQLPFFTLMNTQDLFAQLVLKLHPRVQVRSDVHWLRLSERKDLWYAGGGATNDDVFGFSAIPSGDRRELAYLADVATTVQLGKQLSAYLYYGHAFGQGVVKQTFAGSGADYGYLELVWRL